MEFTELIDLASERLGGAVLYANDEFFAPKENLLKSAEPIFIEGKYTDLGKWMDGWESRRKRAPNLDQLYDWCIIRLGLPGIIRGIIVDTSFFRGNFPSHCSLDACVAECQDEGCSSGCVVAFTSCWEAGCQADLDLCNQGCSGTDTGEGGESGVCAWVE